jgi:hypothetical protein
MVDPLTQNALPSIDAAPRTLPPLNAVASVVDVSTAPDALILATTRGTPLLELTAAVPGGVAYPGTTR